MKKLKQIFMVLIITCFMTGSVYAVGEFDVSGPGIVNEAKNQTTTPTNIGDKISNTLPTLNDGNVNILEFFSIPKDLGAYRSASRSKVFKSIDGKEIDLSKISTTQEVQMHELLFLFGWNTLSKEEKAKELEQNYLKYGIETTRIASDPSVIDIISNVTVWISTTIETATFYITGFTIYITSLSTTNVISEIFYSIGQIINDGIFDWNNPAGFGIGLLVLLVLVGAIIRLFNSSSQEKRNLFTFKGVVDFFLKMIVTFSLAWVTVSQGPVIMKEIDRAVDKTQANLLSGSEKGLTTNMILKSTIFDIMQLTPYKMRTFGIGVNPTNKQIEESFLYSVEVGNKGFLEKLGQGVVDFAGKTTEFLTLGAFQYEDAKEKPISRGIRVVFGIMDAIQVLFFVLIMAILKVLIGAIVVLFAFVRIFFSMIKELSLYLSFIAILPTFFDQNRNAVRWWTNRLQWSFFYMLISLGINLAMLFVLKMIAFLMNANFFLTIIVLIVIVISLFMTFKTLGIEGIKRMMAKLASSFKTEGTVSNMLKDVVMSGVKFTTEDSPFDVMKSEIEQRRNRFELDKQKRESEYETGKTLLSRSFDYSKPFKNTKTTDTSVDDKIKDYDKQNKLKRKDDLLKMNPDLEDVSVTDTKTVGEVKVENSKSDVNHLSQNIDTDITPILSTQENIDEVENSQDVSVTDTITTNSSETFRDVYPSELINEPVSENNKVTPDLDQSKSNVTVPVQRYSDSPDLDEKSMSVPNVLIDVQLERNRTKDETSQIKKRKTKEEREVLQQKNVLTAIRKIDKTLSEFKGDKQSASYKNLVAIKRFVNKQQKLNYDGLRNVNAVIRAAKQESKK